MNWYKLAQLSKNFLKNIEKKKQISLQRGWSPEEIEWAAEMSIKLNDPSYFVWLLNQTRNGSANIHTREDDKKIFDALHRFKKYKQKKMISADINQLKTFADLYQLISQFDNKKDKSNDVSNDINNMQGVEHLYGKNDVNVYKVSAPEAGETLFADSAWCVQNPVTFKEYKPPFYLFRVFEKNHSLYHPATGSFKDRNDSDISLKAILPIFDAVKYFYKNGIIEEYGDARIAIEAIGKEEEINRACLSGDTSNIRYELNKDFAVSNLIKPENMNEDIFRYIKSYFFDHYHNTRTRFGQVVYFYDSIPNYLDINMFPPTKSDLMAIENEIKNSQFNIFGLYNRIPKLLKTNEIKKIVYDETLKLAEKYGLNAWDNCPEEIKNLGREELKLTVYENVYQNAYKLFADPNDWEDVSEEIKQVNYSQICAAACEAWVRELHKNVNIWYRIPLDDLPEDIKQNYMPQFIKACNDNFMSNLQFDPDMWNQIPEIVKEYNYEGLKNQALKSWIYKLEDPVFYNQTGVDHAYWDEVPQDLLNLDYQTLLQHAKNGFLSALARNPLYWKSISRDVKKLYYQEFYTAALRSISIHLQRGLITFDKIPQEFQVPELREYQKTEQSVSKKACKNWFKKSQVNHNENVIENLNDSITLYRGMQNTFDSNFDTAKTDAPLGYSTWTDNKELAKQYAGENGYVYKITLPKSKMGEEIIDKDGERVLFFNNSKSAGLNSISGNEYLVYTYHDDYSPNLISLARSQMNWYKKAQQTVSLIFENIHRDYHSGQHDYTLIAKDSNTQMPVGGIDYSFYQDQIYINDIQVKPEIRRQGIGTQLIQYLKNMLNNTPDVWNKNKINWGMMTPSGSKLYESMWNPENQQDPVANTIQELMSKWKERGVDLYIYETSHPYKDKTKIVLDSIIVPKEQRKQGIGSQILKELCDIADKEQKRIELTVGVKDSFHGTTSRGRLVNFYKRFNFVENKGRNKDFTTGKSMYREPRS